MVIYGDTLMAGRLLFQHLDVPKFTHVYEFYFGMVVPNGGSKQFDQISPVNESP